MNADAPVSKPRKIKQAEYKIRLTAHENQQLIDVRTVCRVAGHRVSKTDLLRAAIALVSTQSSEAIQARVAALKAARKPRAKRSAAAPPP
jgi:hypothetical protein